MRINQPRHQRPATAIDDLGVRHGQRLSRDLGDQIVDHQNIGILHPLFIDAVKDMNVGKEDRKALLLSKRTCCNR
ncbi:MAG: hypothetical protein ABNH38_19760 [Tateyamaria sp.]|jgi:hypothetical protein|uniref:hypothetical protein n=1 Tax=Tateyamaria sp. TaxID=1929288 RepID=UPI0032DE14BB